MKAAKLRDMTVDELGLEETKLAEQIFRLRFQIAASQAENPARVHLLRKDLARVKTILREKVGPGASRMAQEKTAATAVTAPAVKKPPTAAGGKRESVTAASGAGKSKGAARKTAAKRERG